VWRKRIHETIECYRKDLAILNELNKAVLICQVCLKANNVSKKVHSEQEHERTGTKHQNETPNKSPAIMKICTEKYNHYQQRELFVDDTRDFYRRINNQKADVQEPPLASK